MNRKLLVIQLITVVLVVLSAVFINLFTNDDSIKSFLLAKGIGLSELLGVVGVITLLLLIAEYFKFRTQNLDETKKINSSVKQNQSSGDNSQNYQVVGDLTINNPSSVTSHNQSGGQTAQNITNVTHHYAEHKSIDKLDLEYKLDLEFEPYIEPKWGARNKFYARLRIKNNSDKTVHLTNYIDLETKQRPIPLLVKANEPDRTQISINSHLRDYVEVASFIQNSEYIDIISPPEYDNESHLESKVRYEFEIFATGNDLPPYREKFV